MFLEIFLILFTVRLREVILDPLDLEQVSVPATRDVRLRKFKFVVLKRQIRDFKIQRSDGNDNVA